MKIRSFLYVGLTFLATNTMFAQANILNAKIPEEIGMKTEAQLLLDNDKPLLTLLAPTNEAFMDARISLGYDLVLCLRNNTDVLRMFLK